jgi:uncharacterized repeat protein (TIGR03803 family)
MSRMTHPPVEPVKVVQRIAVVPQKENFPMEHQGKRRSVRFAITLRAAPLAIAIVFALTAFVAQSVQAQTFTVLHDFTRGKDGASPQVGLSIDGAGNLFGTTNSGGSAGFGTAFELAPAKKGGGLVLNVLHAFTGGSVGSTDGGGPAARVVFGPNGTLYGSTTLGGNSNTGVVYNLGPASRFSKETILYTFTGGNDGNRPSGDLLFDQTGNIYGTTGRGGATANGVVFELTPSGKGFTEDVLYTFTGGNDGGTPLSGVISDAGGNLYGTATAGGAFGFGAVFELTGTGPSRTEQTLYSFQNGSDGNTPSGGLIFDALGNLYGTTSSGGAGGGGTVFKLTPSGGGSFTFTLLFSFTGSGVTSATGPAATLTMDAAGNIYGTTTNDGAFGQGSVFKLTPSGGGYTFTSLHDFTGGTDGGRPFSNVVFDAAGNLYGTSLQGGADAAGVVFEITP